MDAQSYHLRRACRLVLVVLLAACLVLGQSMPVWAAHAWDGGGVGGGGGGGGGSRGRPNAPRNGTPDEGLPVTFLPSSGGGDFPRFGGGRSGGAGAGRTWDESPAKSPPGESGGSKPSQPPKQQPPKQNQPPKRQPPKQNRPPKQQPPKQNQPPKQQPPKQNQPPKQQPPKQEPPKQEPPKQNEPPKQEPPKGNNPGGTGQLPIGAPPWLSPPSPSPEPSPEPRPRPSPRPRPRPKPQPVEHVRYETERREFAGPEELVRTWEGYLGSDGYRKEYRNRRSENRTESVYLGIARANNAFWRVWREREVWESWWEERPVIPVFREYRTPYYYHVTEYKIVERSDGYSRREVVSEYDTTVPHRYTYRTERSERYGDWVPGHRVDYGSWRKKWVRLASPRVAVVITMPRLPEGDAGSWRQEEARRRAELAAAMEPVWWREDGAFRRAQEGERDAGSGRSAPGVMPGGGFGQVRPQPVNPGGPGDLGRVRLQPVSPGVPGGSRQVRMLPVSPVLPVDPGRMRLQPVVQPGPVRPQPVQPVYRVQPVYPSVGRIDRWDRDLKPAPVVSQPVAKPAPAQPQPVAKPAPVRLQPVQPVYRVQPVYPSVGRIDRWERDLKPSRPAVSTSAYGQGRTVPAVGRRSPRW